MVRDRKVSEFSDRGIIISYGRVAFTIENSQIFFIGTPDLSHPFTRTPVPTHALESARLPSIGYSQVLRIIQMLADPQITSPIVHRVSVTMIDFHSRRWLHDELMQQDDLAADSGLRIPAATPYEP